MSVSRLDWRVLARRLKGSTLPYREAAALLEAIGWTVTPPPILRVSPMEGDVPGSRFDLRVGDQMLSAFVPETRLTPEEVMRTIRWLERQMRVEV